MKKFINLIVGGLNENAVGKNVKAKESVTSSSSLTVVSRNVICFKEKQPYVYYKSNHMLPIKKVINIVIS